MTHITCRLTAKNRDQLRTLRSIIEYELIEVIEYYRFILRLIP